MKKQFNTPNIRIVLMQNNEIVTASLGNGEGNDAPTTCDAATRVVVGVPVPVPPSEQLPN